MKRWSSSCAVHWHQNIGHLNYFINLTQSLIPKDDSIRKDTLVVVGASPQNLWAIEFFNIRVHISLFCLTTIRSYFLSACLSYWHIPTLSWPPTSISKYQQEVTNNSCHIKSGTWKCSTWIGCSNYLTSQTSHHPMAMQRKYLSVIYCKIYDCKWLSNKNVNVHY